MERRPHWQERAGRVFELLRRHDMLLMLGFRFMYGLRIVTPFALGASRVRPLKFLVLNAIGALLWASVIGTLGYLFGRSAEAMLGNVERYELWIFAGLAAAGVLAWALRRLRQR